LKPGVANSLSHYNSDADFSLQFEPPVDNLMNGFAAYTRAVGEELSIPIPFKDYPEISSWFTWQVKNEAFVRAIHLKDAAQAGVPLETAEISSFLEGELRRPKVPQNKGYLEAAIEIAGYAINADIQIDPTLIEEATEYVLGEGESLDYRALEPLFEKGGLRADFCFRILLTAPTISAHMLNFVLKQNPERATELLARREGEFSSFELEALLVAIEAQGSQALNGNVNVFNRVRGTLLSELEMWEA
ncbi:MAG: hypothetical protein KDD52_09800, partial [Bdellovibrionales bacterium]|nr:hypothetical protein [Bdellovibrionales bacterium]